MSPKLAVIQFPGSNCEYETRRAAAQYGFDAEIVRWTVDRETFDRFDAYILPGGFSYQDRVRAGVIASKLPVLQFLAEAAEKGKLILGICNGCQILAEAGLVPGLGGKAAISIALAHNARQNRPVGFICDWVNVKVQTPKASVFTRYFSENDIFPIPINHGEGRFVLSPEVEAVLPTLSTFVYCSAEGQIETEFPINPNGSQHNLAGMGSQKGNVFAIMPHPERAAFLKQVPESAGKWGLDKIEGLRTGSQKDGPWAPLFVSMADFLTKG